MRFIDRKVHPTWCRWSTLSANPGQPARWWGMIPFDCQLHFCLNVESSWVITNVIAFNFCLFHSDSQFDEVSWLEERYVPWVFRPDLRRYSQLESLWQKSPPPRCKGISRNLTRPPVHASLWHLRSPWSYTWILSCIAFSVGTHLARLSLPRNGGADIPHATSSKCSCVATWDWQKCTGRDGAGFGIN